MAEQGRKFEFLSFRDEGLGATNFVLIGDMTSRPDGERLEAYIDDKLACSGDSYSVVQMNGLTHLHAKGVGCLIKLATKLQSAGGIVVVIGLNHQPLQLLVHTLRNEMFKVFHFAADRETAERILVNRRALAAKADSGSSTEP